MKSSINAELTSLTGVTGLDTSVVDGLDGGCVVGVEKLELKHCSINTYMTGLEVDELVLPIYIALVTNTIPCAYSLSELIICKKRSKSDTYDTSVRTAMTVSFGQ